MRRTAIILVIDEDSRMRSYVRTLLELEGYTVEVASDDDFLSKLQTGSITPNMAILGISAPGFNGLEVLRQLTAFDPALPVITVSSLNEPRLVAQSLRLGAREFIVKPFSADEFHSVVRHNLQPAAELHDPAASEVLPGDIVKVTDELSFVGASPEMRKIRQNAAAVAASDIPVLLLGESGTGKEVVAKLIHSFSHRADRPFLNVNCAAIPSDLLESELFGYEPGAFTGASKSKPGMFELCNHGTILLDEIGEMSAALQAKLLHVLQDQHFTRLGGRTRVQVDVRIISATNIDMHSAIRARQFREDVYYRLAGFTMHVPPLRQRKQEIPILLRHLVSRIAARYGRPEAPISDRMIDACMQHDWPGNVRELENFLKRYLVLGDEEAAISEIENSLRHGPVLVKPPSRGQHASLRSVRKDAEAEYIRKALDATNWRRKDAAERLSISYKALLYKIRQYNIKEPAAFA